ncbi:hypothetical protein [Pararhodonellum marinum]|uniref:hypothetical protein n=1 Tax=Pararhodonellum marinum TaxID=2755358 RepID=UPI001890582E|nr:hypothetical protein [Pararhodonellum marinum]
MSTEKKFVASPEGKGKAKQLRMFALLAWLIAMVGQVVSILYLINDETLTYLIIAIVVILALAITGSTLWKKANRLDPASEADQTKFFFQNQFGAIMNVLAFLPMVILILTNKEASGKTKGIAGGIAAVAMLIAGISGADFDPPSVEKYTEQINSQTEVVKKLNYDSDNVYWSRAGNRYHLFDDCQHIRGREQSLGSVQDSWDEKGISELCKTCQARAIRDRNITDADLDIPVLEGEDILEN